MNVLTALCVWTLGCVCLVLGGYQGLALAEVMSAPPLVEGILGGLLPVIFGVLTVPLWTLSYTFLLARMR